MSVQKLNFGCGTRIASGWTNIDFHSSDARVRRVNLLHGFPFPDQLFDVVYSSHVLEHFTREQGRYLIGEARRVLKPGGILRVVVPDLEGSCREYLKILNLPDSDPTKAAQYEWILLELLDQLVRNVPGGEMFPFVNQVMNGPDQGLRDYVRSRTESLPWAAPPAQSPGEKLSRITPQKIATKLNYWYLKAVAGLIPKPIRSMVFIGTAIGERHRWMYDAHGLKLLLEQAGLADCRVLSCRESAIPNFTEDLLDVNPDGSPYKNNSLYMEGRKRA